MVSSTLKQVSIRFPESVSRKRVGSVHSKCSSRHRHSPQQSWANTLPETSQSLSSISLLEAVPHADELPLSTESITLHLTLDNIQRVAAQPERLTGHTTIRGDLQAGNILALDVVALGVLVHEELERQEPHTVGLDFTEVGHSLTSEKTPHHAFVGRELLDAVNGTVV